MAASHEEVQVLWSSANTITLSDVNYHDSDEFTISADYTDLQVTVRADNAGTPASGDVCEVLFLATSGDVDNAAGANDYPGFTTTTSAQANPIALLDTYVYDPDMTTRVLPAGGSKGKLRVRASGWTSGHNIVVAARLSARKGAIA